MNRSIPSITIDEAMGVRRMGTRVSLAMISRSSGTSWPLVTITQAGSMRRNPAMPARARSTGRLFR
jgi:hypothetical protein